MTTKQWVPIKIEKSLQGLCQTLHARAQRKMNATSVCPPTKQADLNLQLGPHINQQNEAEENQNQKARYFDTIFHTKMIKKKHTVSMYSPLAGLRTEPPPPPPLVLDDAMTAKK